MKFNLYLLSLFSLIIFAACSSDDDNEDPMTAICEAQSSDMSGEIEGSSWSLSAGTAEEFTDVNGIVKWSIDMFDEISSATGPCSIFSSSDRIFFSMPKDLGVRELLLDFNDVENSQTITLFDEETFNNIIVSSGCIEILEITNEVIRGQVDAMFDSDNFINGQFELAVCN